MDKKNRMILKFFTIFGSILAVFFIVSFIAVYGYIKITGSQKQVGRVNILEPTGDLTETPKPSEKPGLFTAPEKTNFLIVGTDQGDLLTDVIMVGSFDSGTKRISMISIPRDTRVELPKSVVQDMQNNGDYPPPSSGVMKMNAVNLYGGKKNGMRFLQEELERFLGIEIDFWASVDLEAFKEIVDAVGGVEMDVRPQGYYYWDPTQNLRINVKGGHQILDGEAAEGVVRFRSDYYNGDVDRIEVQHEFMKEFFRQVVNKEAIMGNLTDFISIVMNRVNTNFSLTDLPKYLKYAKDIKGENLSMETLPGEGRYMGEVSYFINDQAETAELVENVFYSTVPLSESGDEELNDSEDDNGNSSNESSEEISSSPQASPIDTKTLRIQVLNGGEVSGLAAYVGGILENDGYNVLSVDNYNGRRVDETRIMVREYGSYHDLRGYFKNATVEVDDAMPAGFDVIIIVGNDERIE